MVNQIVSCPVIPDITKPKKKDIGNGKARRRNEVQVWTYRESNKLVGKEKLYPLTSWTFLHKTEERLLGPRMTKKLLNLGNHLVSYVRIPGGYSTKFSSGRIRSEVQLLTLLYGIVERKSTPFVYPLSRNGTPFTSLPLYFLSTAVNALSYRYE